MNREVRRWLSAGAWISLIFIVLASATLVLDHFTAGPFAATVKQSVEATLSESNADFPLPAERIRLGAVSDPSTLAWKAVRGKKDAGYVFAVRVTGNSGPWPVIFVYDPAEGTIFAGIAGRPDGYANPERYGLTPRVLTFWRSRFDSIAASLEVTP